MLRSLYSGIAGLRSHQTMLDVTGNNIANVNTTGFKASAIQFQDTLSQAVQGATGAQAERGGTNPAQIGLGVRVAGITTNFSQGSTQATGRATDTLISGDGLFMVQKGGETLYTRAGAFDFDAQGRLVTPDGGIVQGWAAVNGVINQGAAVGNVSLPRNGVSPAIPSGTATVTGNLPEDAAIGTQFVRDTTVFDASGTDRQFTLTFTRTTGGWDVAGTDANGATGASTLQFTGGALTGGGAITVGGIGVDMTALTGFSGLSTTTISKQDGRAAGSLTSYSIATDGTIVGAFSNGSAQPIARIALAIFSNAAGLEKAGASGYRATLNSGAATLGAPGDPGVGSLAGGALEMSNVDLSQEFTNLIVAQRGFQANARIITTSDEVLQELTNLKR